MTKVERNLVSERAESIQAVRSSCLPEVCWHFVSSAVSPAPVPGGRHRVWTPGIGFLPSQHLFSYQIFLFLTAAPDFKVFLTFLLCFTNLKHFFPQPLEWHTRTHFVWWALRKCTSDCFWKSVQRIVMQVLLLPLGLFGFRDLGVDLNKAFKMNVPIFTTLGCEVCWWPQAAEEIVTISAVHHSGKCSCSVRSKGGWGKQEAALTLSIQPRL